MPVSGPTLARRQLGRRLKRLREAATMTFAQAEAAHLGSHAKLWRIETGQVPVKVPDVREMCRVYRATDAETEQLVDLALATSRPGWWQEFRDVIPEWLRIYVDLEATADHIRAWEDSVVPGELQTPGYARAVFVAAHGDNGRAAVDRQIEVRMQRQERLFARAPRLTIVLGEAVLARQVGGGEVMADQVNHLRQLGEKDHIDIRYLPFATGAHAAMTGAFRVFAYTEGEDPDVAYVESEVDGRYIEIEEEVARYRAIFERIYTQSVPIGEYR
ncbi:helix-turn-helix transcriptional regulator [Virgisporangium ochraceum]|uniref:Transcriptional regulator n=1 Tax=Virgisporangium ochraceum TaxID=65505 RepID=A0A8J3ZLT0_9ACTN|nr:transcriptional regulator [Virgisporangium ochraceum]